MSTSRIENGKDIIISLPPPDPSKPDRPVDPVTGEINWDCPCMQGYIHGPCGDTFRTAYSCYIEASSSEDAMEQCTDKFRTMQACFDRHPEFYHEDPKDDEDEESAGDGQTLGGAGVGARIEQSDSEGADSAVAPTPATVATGSLVKDNPGDETRPASTVDSTSARSAS
ncbi:Oxidoreductase [Tieghemiomyces parasiticus]|uniref:Mitochondrial intermembrane space import and assembly protein 40 n=1 Tax=Tieghemiomyces parasiticus TaxID=78921 RepID=A0A9W8AGA7_9FUNG|nr:Oxidoreductase [Tieghemiomyces parasiticus]